MMLAYYRKEHDEFPDHYALKLSWDECVIVHHKLCTHYKLPIILYYRGRVCGNARSNGVITLGRSGMSVGVLCHEVAHLLAYRKYHEMRHNKRMYRVMRGVMNYAKKKGYWKDELERRTAPKPVKPEPTKDELRQKAITKRKDELLRYEKRLGYYTKLYTNKMKKARRSLMMLERAS
jgi:hypothetical protein